MIVFTVLYDVGRRGRGERGDHVGVLGLPLAAGMAILRYRLYDIDVVINRTLVYGALTATLAAAYLGCVLLLQLVLARLPATPASRSPARRSPSRPCSGPPERASRPRSTVASTGASTTPQRTLEAFSARLRDQVDLGTLNAELSSVVRDTLQPAHVSLWLRSTD